MWSLSGPELRLKKPRSWSWFSDDVTTGAEVGTWSQSSTWSTLREGTTGLQLTSTAESAWTTSFFPPDWQAVMCLFPAWPAPESSAAQTMSLSNKWRSRTSILADNFSFRSLTPAEQRWVASLDVPQPQQHKKEKLNKYWQLHQNHWPRMNAAAV